MIPQPFADPWLTLNARKTPAGTTIPPNPATNGRATRQQSRELTHVELAAHFEAGDERRKRSSAHC